MIGSVSSEEETLLFLCKNVRIFDRYKLYGNVIYGNFETTIKIS